MKEVKTRRREVDVEIEVRKREKKEEKGEVFARLRTDLFTLFGQVSGSELRISRPISMEYQQVT